MLFFWLPKNPFLISLYLVFVSCLVGVVVSENLSSWAGSSLILVYSGGMMVMFTYISSLGGGASVAFSMKKFVIFAFFFFLFMFTDLTFGRTGSSFPVSLSVSGESVVLYLLVILAVLFVCSSYCESFKGPINNIWGCGA